MTQEQKDIFEDVADTVLRAFDTLEAAELKLRELGKLKHDEADPYGITAEDLADRIYEARNSLDEATDLLHLFRDDDVEEAK